MPWLNLQAEYRFGPQARAQAFDESRGFHADGPAMLSRLPQRVGSKHAANQSPRSQLAGAHRFRQNKLIQTFGQQLTQTAGIRCRNCKPEPATGYRSLAMLQETFELHDAALPEAEVDRARCGRPALSVGKAAPSPDLSRPPR